MTKIEQDSKCAEYSCEKAPTHIVYWPGKVPPPKYCWGHMLRAVEILEAMGTPVHWEEIK